MFQVLVAIVFFVLPISVLPKGEDAGLKPRRYIEGSGNKQSQEKAGVLAGQGTKMVPDKEDIQ